MRASVAAAAMVVLLAGCAAPLPVRVAPPEPDCARLTDLLPDTLDGRDRRDTEPVSDQTAAWGEPPVVLRCGVQRPVGLSATSEVLAVEQVDWFLTESPHAYVFTTVGRTPYVELRVPRSTARDRATAPLVDLARAVRRSVPRR